VSLRVRHRWPLALLAVVAGSAVIILARWTYRNVTATPAAVVDYGAKMEELAGSHQPAGDNGWDLFIDAAGITAAIVDEMRIELTEGEPRPGLGIGLDLDAGRYNPLDRELIAPELRVLELIEEQGVLDLLDEAAVTRRVVRPIAGASPLINISLPELAQFRNLAKARASSMRLAADAGDHEARLRGFEHNLALGRACASQTTLIDRLVGIAIIALALEELRCELIEHAIDEPTGRALLDAMDRHLPLPPPTLALEGERLFALDMIQWCFTDDGHGDGRLDVDKVAGLGAMVPAPVTSSIFGRAQALALAGRTETTEVVNEFYDGVEKVALMTPTERVTASFDIDQFVEGLGYRHWFPKIFLPAVGKSVKISDNMDVLIVATRVAIALEMHRHRHGALPESLDALAPDFLPAAPVDPMHGGPLIYRRVADAPGGYDLYSTGIDEVDDSNTAPEPDARVSLRDRNSAYARGRDFEPNREREILEIDE